MTDLLIVESILSFPELILGRKEFEAGVGGKVPDKLRQKHKN